MNQYSNSQKEKKLKDIQREKIEKEKINFMLIRY